MGSSSGPGRASRTRRRPLAVAPVLVLVVTIACTAAAPAAAPVAPTGGPVASETPATRTASPEPEPDADAVADAATLELARRKIDHIVFLVKENRTYDHLFGRFPGADGATDGRTCDGDTVPLRRADDDSPGASHGL